MIYTNNRGEEQEEAPGPQGNRMMQLGILTRAQKKKPEMNPVDQSAAAQMLTEKAQERRQQALNKGPASTVSEADPMKKSSVPRPVKMGGR